MFTQTLHLILLITLLQTEGRPVNTHQKPSISCLSIDSLLPSLETLENSIRKHHTQAAQILIKEFNHQEKTNLLNYLPTIGYNFLDLAATLTYNSSRIARSINNQRSKKAKRIAIQEHMKMNLESELIKLYRHYADLEAEIAYYNTTIELFILHQTLFNLQLEQYNNLETTPTAFMKNQIKLKEEELKLMKKYTTILKLRNQILEMAQIEAYKPDPDEKDT